MIELKWICNVFICIFEVSMFHGFLSASYEQSCNTKNQIMKLSLLVILLTGVNYFENPFLNLFGGFGLYFLFAKLVFVLSWKMDFIYVMFFYIISACGEIGFEFLFGALFHVKNMEQADILFGDVLLILLEKLVIFVIFICIRYFLKKSESHQTSKFLTSFLVIPLSTFVIFYGILSVNYSVMLAPDLKMLLSFGCFCLLFCNTFVFFLFDQLSYLMLKSKEYEKISMKSHLEQRHYKNLEQINDKHKKYIHDMNKYFSTIGILAKEADNHAIVQLLNQIKIDVAGINEETYSENPILNAILIERENTAKMNQISTTVFVEPNLKLSTIRELDLISMIGNLLDNAIEACSRCESHPRLLKVQIFMGNRHFLVIQVENTYENQLQPHGKFFESTKKDKKIEHGLGLSKVEELARKYGGILNIEIGKDTFLATLGLSINLDSGQKVYN